MDLDGCACMDSNGNKVGGMEGGGLGHVRGVSQAPYSATLCRLESVAPNC